MLEIYEQEDVLWIDLRDSSDTIISEVIAKTILACKDLRNEGYELNIKIYKDDYE